MDNAPSALIFPETEPSIPGMAKLLIFFTVLSYYRPIESGGPSSGENNLCTRFCNGYTPAPLGAELPRFNRLLREMETSRPEEFSRLFAAVQPPGVGAGQGRDPDETSAGSVYAAMHADAALKAGIAHKERLWQARLLLKLAEILDRRETEVRQGLAQISCLQQKLFASLEGPAETASADLIELGDPDKTLLPGADDTLPDASFSWTSIQFIPQRLKAWAELFLADSSNLHTLLLATAIPESGAILLDGYENIWRRDPEKLFSLALPPVKTAAIDGTWDRFLAARDTFRDTVQENLAYFASFLQEKAGSPGSAPENRAEIAALPENISAWEAKLKVRFPDTEKGANKLDFYAFPGISYAELFQRLFHLEGPAATNRPTYPTALLAILTS
jgi:hypothetical protein